jgi:hypothetical protein
MYDQTKQIKQIKQIIYENSEICQFKSKALIWIDSMPRINNSCSSSGGGGGQQEDNKAVSRAQYRANFSGDWKASSR